MSGVGGVGGAGSTPQPQGQDASSTNWRLKDYNDQAYADAYYTMLRAEDIIEMLNEGGGADPKIQQAYDKLHADYVKVGQGAPPSQQDCENFIKDVKNFQDLAKNEGLSGSRYSFDMQTITQEMSKFKNWVDAGEPKA